MKLEKGAQAHSERRLRRLKSTAGSSTQNLRLLRADRGRAAHRRRATARRAASETLPNFGMSRSGKVKYTPRFAEKMVSLDRKCARAVAFDDP